VGVGCVGLARRRGLDSIAAFYRQGVGFQKIIAIAARFGLVRALARKLPMLMLPDDDLGLALCVTHTHASAAADDLRCLVTASPEARLPDAPGALGHRPLALLTHGIPFPPVAAAMEEEWADGQQALARLSTDSELIVAEKSGHLIHVDEPQLVVETVHRVYVAVSKGRSLTQANSC
jgi:pimeloyl-ACP methyl ester carboxylesterase